MPQRLDRLAAMVTDARQLVRDLATAGVRIDAVHTTSLMSLASALGTARGLEGV